MVTNQPASLASILEALDMQSDEFAAYVHRETGQVVTLSEEAMSAAEFQDSDDDTPAWQLQEIELARKVAEDEAYLELPDRFEINEYNMMERFAGRTDDTAVADRLLGAIQGRGAFRRFKDVLHSLDMVEAWYEYRRLAFETIATEWCEAHGIKYTRDQRSRSDA